MSKNYTIMKYLFGALLSVLLFSCQSNSNEFTLSGTAEGMPDGSPIIIYAIENNQPTVIDTLTINSGKFSGTYAKSDIPSLNYMMVNNSSIIYFPQSEDLKATIYKDSIQASFVIGNAQNDSYRTYVKTMQGFQEKKTAKATEFQKARAAQDNSLAATIQRENVMIAQEEKNYKESFAEENPNSLFSVMLVSEMLNKKQISAKEASDYVASFSPEIQKSTMAKEIQAVAANMKNSDVGGKAPAFSAKTPEGKDLSLADAMGEYTIIDFWASWCRPCRMENPNVVKVYEKYHDKGLNIISVSLDKAGSEARWKKAIADDNMDWYHVSNLQFWQDPIVQAYSVRSIPATFLLDKDGVIVAKNLRGPALGAKIAELLD